MALTSIRRIAESRGKIKIETQNPVSKGIEIEMLRRRMSGP
jgi:hypothetical protein